MFCNFNLGKKFERRRWGLNLCIEGNGEEAVMAATYDEAEKRVYGGLGLVTAPADLFTANTISNNVGLHNVGPTTGLRNGLNLRRNLTLTRETGLPLLYIASGLPLPSIPGGGGFT